MSRARRGKPVHGVVLLDKPEGLSSNQALQKVRRLFEARKAGHTGSLDPFATGMLPICLGEASKTAGYMLDADKAYRATMKLGQATETGDTEGAVVEEQPVPPHSDAEIAQALNAFRGEIDQVPPMYSALKHQGQPLYKLARAGKTVERAPRRVAIREISLVERTPDTLTFEVQCSKGTYIRTLAEDIGRALDTCAHLVALRRLWVQPFEDATMVTLDQLRNAAEEASLSSWLLPLDAGLQSWPVCELDAEAARRFAHGNPVDTGRAVRGWHRVTGPDGQPIGLGEGDSTRRIAPRRVYHFES
ncbi:MAG: tRNA pseudouridine(55) synthase TruB [Xanthomonadales bacterium]|nr:tRNA pseudouridine(55) synthase TruB [Xanthomonadales bacterium]